jgi:hypothetical protein
VLDYRISWDLGGGTYEYLQSGVTSTSYTTTVTLSPGVTYKFKVEARNSFGFSIQPSNEVTIIAATIPNAPTLL